MAIQCNLPGFVESTLQRHVLDAFPKGAECRELFAQAYFLQKNFSGLMHHLQLCPRNLANLFLSVCADGYTKHQWNCTQLLFAPQNQYLGRFLSDSHRIFWAPEGSIPWACFFAKQKRFFSSHEVEKCQQLILEIKYAMNTQAFSGKVPLTLWKNKALALWERKENQVLKKFLKHTMVQLKNTKEKTICLWWMFRVYRVLQKPTDPLFRTYGSLLEKEPEYAEAIFSEWLCSSRDAKQQWESLPFFYDVFTKKKQKFFAQIVLLLRVKAGIECGLWEEARMCLEKELLSLDRSLQETAYVMLAKIALCSSPANYLLAADRFSEACRLATEETKRFAYEQKRCWCYVLEGNHERAYWEYEGALSRFEGSPLAAQLAEEWCECGILCHATAEELEQQVDYCQKYYGLSPEVASKVRLDFAQYQWEQKQGDLALEVLQQHSFSKPSEQARAKLLTGKCLFQRGDTTQALQIFSQMVVDDLPVDLQADYYLWRGTVEHALQKEEEAKQSLQCLGELKGVIPMDLQAQAALLQAEVQIVQQEYVQAKQSLLQFAEKSSKTWRPFLLFQAGLDAENHLSAEDAISIYQAAYEADPLHPLAKDARLKQGTLFLHAKRYQEAQSVLESILSKLEGTQAFWCKFLLKKCQWLAGTQSLAWLQTQLERLLQENLPCALRLEVVFQLASVYQEQGQETALQTCLWKECYPLFEKEPQNFSVNDLYWFNRCLLLLAQHLNSVEVRKLYALMVEAQLPSASLLQNYFQNE